MEQEKKNLTLDLNKIIEVSCKAIEEQLSLNGETLREVVILFGLPGGGSALLHNGPNPEDARKWIHYCLDIAPQEHITLPNVKIEEGIIQINPNKEKMN